ncbi:hypothetical protein N1M2_18 [Klebsiella phage N1M2]|uniref:Uncharacterized protein n=1 Tax=Klebsiella phage N1M2 TaxID=2664939 RepID=A0A6B7ZFB5_9CAUD|nr:hypothetical protein PQB72_gp018 [Klebsiella phage N1M2]QGH71881.1 hypothetical protein N1M2_18 [Klebsiella phage N1M2]
MLTLKNKLAILFDNEQDREELETLVHTARTTIIRRTLRDIINNSSAMGIGDLEEGSALITEEELASGVPVTFDLLQVDTPIIVRATIQRYGDVGSNYVTLQIDVKLSERKPSYLMQHNVTTLFVESVSVPRLWKRIDRILKDVPSLAAPLLAN